MQYYKKPIDAEQELLEENVDKILRAVDKIYDVRILGRLEKNDFYIKKSYLCC